MVVALFHESIARKLASKRCGRYDHDKLDQMREYDG
jgi:hypothetical protein